MSTPHPTAETNTEKNGSISPALRLHTPQTATTHYVSEFTLGAKNGSHTEAFSVAMRILLDWINRKARNPDFGMREERYGGDNATPEVWALHLQHREPTSEYRRFWHIDVSFVRRGTDFDVRVSVSHTLDFGFVGWTPTPPEPSAPNFICEWLGHPSLTLRSGQFPIAGLTSAKEKLNRKIKERIGALTVSPATADKLARLIFDPNRRIPVLVINGELNPITFPLNPNGLQQLLLGTCYVVWATPAPGWGQAWREHFPNGFDCRNNSVRLYQPNASHASSYDAVRHRYFTDDDILTHGGSSAFISMIRDGLTRRLLEPRPGRVSTCEDVLTLRATEAFNQQRSKLNSTDEELELYRSEHQRLTENASLDAQLLQETDAELQRTKSELAALRPHAAELTKQLESARAAPAAESEAYKSKLLLRFYKNEATVADQLHAIQAIDPTAVHLLPSAIRSAEAATGFEHRETLRELLLTLVTDYRRLLVTGKGNHEACRVFGRGDFATKEADNLTQKGRIARTFIYNSQEICMEQHLKIGVKDSEAHCLRIHFFWDATAQKIVIGHCGKHLPL